MSKVKTNLDLIQWLGDDMSTKVFSYLDDPRDLIRVSVVSKSWEKIGKLFEFIICSSRILLCVSLLYLVKWLFIWDVFVFTI